MKKNNFQQTETLNRLNKKKLTPITSKKYA